MGLLNLVLWGAGVALIVIGYTRARRPYARYQALKRRGHLDVRLVPVRDQLAESLLEIVRPGDLVLTLGAGDVYKCADELLGLLRAGAPVPAVH